jgi:hypothetical protein
VVLQNLINLVQEKNIYSELTSSAKFQHTNYISTGIAKLSNKKLNEYLSLSLKWKIKTFIVSKLINKKFKLIIEYKNIHIWFFIGNFS